ncbi:MAG: hybrid sensor histidine kinase/response regulator [Deltaproteobacteria bacterium]|nr:hybrid sensor histidine kinase/response regulator [Deltaproteobacteria bacterium]
MCRSVFPAGVELVEERRGGADLVVPDAGAVEQVLVNVLINARDAVAASSVATPRIVLVVSPTPAAPGDTAPSVRITVEDNGPGVPDDLRDRVFEPFFTTKGPSVGTGLGLASSYATVTSLGGRITCEAAPTGGARFVIDLPAADAAASPTTPLPPSAAPVAPCLVAIVDDDSDTRRALSRLVESGGHQVLELGSLDEATAALKARTDVAVVLLARSLAGGRGTELLSRVPDLPGRTRTLLLAAGEVPESEAARVSGVLGKPIGRDALLAAIAATARR